MAGLSRSRPQLVVNGFLVDKILGIGAHCQRDVHLIVSAAGRQVIIGLLIFEDGFSFSSSRRSRISKASWIFTLLVLNFPID